MFTLAEGAETADQYIVAESFKLLSLFGIAGGWIIAALILAPVFWKAGEERWKAYIPVYKWMVTFQLASWPRALGLIGLVPWALGLIGIVMGTGASITLVWFQFFAAFAGPIPALLTLLGALSSAASSQALVVAVLATIAALIFQILYGVAVYRIGVHLRHSNTGWLVLSILLPVASLIVFAADASVWREDEEIGWQSGKIAAEVPRRTY